MENTEGKEGNAGAVDPNVVTLDENGYIPGTQYRSVPDLIKGHTELKGKFDSQGNDLGTVRKSYESVSKQAETLAGALKEKMDAEKATPQKTTDFDTEITAVQKQIQELDPMADGYQRTLGELVAKSNKLSAVSQHEKTLTAASSIFKKELDDRDVKATHKSFLDANPTFNTPETQARIKKYLANDKTGMSDPLVAFREIQRDDITVLAKKLEGENAEMKKVLDLQKGKDSTGKVITKGTQSVQVTKPTKATGAALDQGMKEALNKVNSVA